jgi:regulator of replication initiation timing
MEHIQDIESRVDQLYSKIDDINAELYSLGGEEERFEIFERLRELISQKEQENDLIAAAVLGWAYEELSNV